MAARPDRGCISARLAKTGVITYFPEMLAAWGGGGGGGTAGNGGVTPKIGVSKSSMISVC